MNRDNYWHTRHDETFTTLFVKLGTSREYADRWAKWNADILTTAKYGNQA